MSGGTDYLAHLLTWMLPVVAIQWGIAWRIFLRNLKAVVIPPLLFGTYYSLADLVAIREGVWYFDPAQILGLKVGPIPIEEILFFYITALLVSQSFVMLLPGNLRR